MMVLCMGAVHWNVLLCLNKCDDRGIWWLLLFKDLAAVPVLQYFDNKSLNMKPLSGFKWPRFCVK